MCIYLAICVLYEQVGIPVVVLEKAEHLREAGELACSLPKLVCEL